MEELLRDYLESTRGLVFPHKDTEHATDYLSILDTHNGAIRYIEHDRCNHDSVSFTICLSEMLVWLYSKIKDKK